jgi:V8-like Glu-specific endopeptidase
VEISDINYIKDFFHINPQALKNNINIFIGKDIFITQYPSGRKFSLSTGNILGISKNNYFVHTCSTMKGSSGSPIILRDDSSIIGLHHSSFSEMEEDGKKKIH